jgi:hypothetical protein
MDWGEAGIALAVAGASIVAAYWLVRLSWWCRGAWRIRRAGPTGLRVSRHRLWHDPGRPDLRYGPGGREGVPVPPFLFVEEHHAGSQPCVGVRDARGRLWRVKWGHEVRPESFAVRFAHGCGYFAEVTHYVAEGTIEGATNLTRARSCIDENCRFVEARFELEDPDVHMFFNEHSWSWDDNPFVGTRELSGLKIVVMLLSNWDTKDRRDVGRGSNTAIFEHTVGPFAREARYLITDWGGAMGKWGTNVIARGRWDPAGFEAQTPYFITGLKDGIVHFGYQGQRTPDVAYNVPVEHARWFHQYASRIGEQDLRDGLLAGGATEEEASRFARALLDRISQLGIVCGSLSDQNLQVAR